MIKGMDPSLAKLAAKYIWWEPPTVSLKNKNRFLCYTLNLATWEDMEIVEKKFSREELREALDHAPAGVMHAKSWNYWHLRLGYKTTPPLPKKEIQP